MTLTVVIVAGILGVGGLAGLAFTVWVLLHAMERLNAAHAVERERLILAALEPSELTQLRKLEISAEAQQARTEALARIQQERIGRHLDDAEDDRRYENV